MRTNDREAWEIANRAPKYFRVGDKKIEIATRGRWLSHYVQVDVFYGDWEMYSWGDFRHHCTNESPDAIHETRPNVKGTLFKHENLVCRDCTTVMPEDAKRHFHATARICTFGHEPPMEFYGLTFHTGLNIMNPTPGSFYINYV